MFSPAFICGLCDLTLHFYFWGSVCLNLIDILIHLVAGTPSIWPEWVMHTHVAKNLLAPP